MTSSARTALFQPERPTLVRRVFIKKKSSVGADLAEPTGGASTHRPTYKWGRPLGRTREPRRFSTRRHGAQKENRIIRRPRAASGVRPRAVCRPPAVDRDREPRPPRAPADPR